MMTLASVLKEHWTSFVQRFSYLVAKAHRRAAQAVMSCRTPELGGELYACGPCGEQQLVFHSCNHRACPQCGGLAQKEWAAAQEAKLLPVAYFFMGFTVPDNLRQFIYTNQSWVYDLMFQAVADVLKHFGLDPNKLGGHLGFTAVLHTWTREMVYHPHIHVIIPGIALDEEGLRLKHARGRKYLFNVHALGAAWRNRLRSLIAQRDRALEAAQSQAKTKPQPAANQATTSQAPGQQQTTTKQQTTTEPKPAPVEADTSSTDKAEPKQDKTARKKRQRKSREESSHDEPSDSTTASHSAISQIPVSVWKKNWVVHCQRAGDGKNTLRYLARYVTKSAVSNQRLLGYDDNGNIKLNCQDSDTGEWSRIHLTPDEPTPLGRG